MKLSNRPSEEPDVNLTPMIDVVFLLLLFFMVSTSFVRESTLEIMLPQSSTLQPLEAETPIEIRIDAQNRFRIGDIELLQPSLEQLQQALREATQDRVDPVIVISADASAAYQSIVSALDSAQALGMHRITLSTQQSADSP